MNIIDKFKEHNKKRTIMGIIDSEIKSTFKKFGHVIREEDIEEEKKVIYDVFKDVKFKKMVEYTDSEYNKLYSSIFSEITSELDEIARYYFYDAGPYGAKTWYTCHLQSVVVKLIYHFINEN